MKMGRKCAVESCLSDSGRLEDAGVTFHKVPSHSDIRPKWFSLCRIPDDKKSQKVIYICSRHFLRVDFCNFKGKKYMLRQGVLPSVFPWDKSKLEAIKNRSSGSVKEEIMTDEETPGDSSESPQTSTGGQPPKTEEALDLNLESVKQEIGTGNTELLKEPGTLEVPAEEGDLEGKLDGPMNFAINSRIEALDFNNTWYPARIVERDYEENEVLIHFEKYSSKYDEWICVDSPRLRPLQPVINTPSSGSKKGQIHTYVVGERCLGTWSDSRKFPATVSKVLPNDTYEVLFDDGYVKNLKANRMSKSGRPTQSSPLFDPIQSSKEERRERKRKIDIAALFGKRPRSEHSTETRKSSSTTSLTPQSAANLEADDTIYDPWVPEWQKGFPVGIESVVETSDGNKKSYIVPDPRLPQGWSKHLVQRVSGASAGKWDTIIVSPDSRRFRARSEIKHYLEENKTVKYNWSRFDFSIHRHRNRKKELELERQHQNNESMEVDEAAAADTTTNVETTTQEEEENVNLLKIPVVDDGYQCPIEGCGKVYRRENLAAMHVKHYHPEYTKFLDSTPNVADLAYARTVGESLNRSPNVSRTAPTPGSSSRPSIKSTRSSNRGLAQEDSNTTATSAAAVVAPHSPAIPSPPSLTSTPNNNNHNINNSNKHKDSEIIKLLNSKPGESDANALPSGLPPDMYPDIKLKDLLGKGEALPNRDEMRALSTARPAGGGVRTLLPVTRQQQQQQQQQGVAAAAAESGGGRGARRRRAPVAPEPPSLRGDQSQESQPSNYTNNVIIEGGQVIKIVRMKQEEIINCTCGYPEEDGLMIQCDLCLCWQHAFCNNIERESQVPEKYVCYICQNPLRQRMSKKYFHDQDWLNKGLLASTSFHTKDEDLMRARFEKLKKSHDISGGLLEVKDFVNTLKVKLKIAEAKNHPKLYLWSKSWDKPPLPEKAGLEIEKGDEKDVKPDDEKNESMLMAILKNNKTEKDEKPSLKEPKEEKVPENAIRAPIIPQPEAAINSGDCRLNLLDHIDHYQKLVDERLDDFEKQIDALENVSFYEENENYPRTRQTISMLLRDLNTLNEFSQITTL